MAWFKTAKVGAPATAPRDSGIVAEASDYNPQLEKNKTKQFVLILAFTALLYFFLTNKHTVTHTHFTHSQEHLLDMYQQQCKLITHRQSKRHFCSRICR